MRVTKIIAIKIKAKNEEQVNWAMLLFRDMLKKAKKDIIEDGLEITIREYGNLKLEND